MVEKNKMFIKEIYYAIKHSIRKDKDICPRCSHVGFSHGFFSNEEYYCLSCHLWDLKNTEEIKKLLMVVKRNE